MKKFILILTLVLAVIYGVTWKTHYNTVQNVRTQIAIEADVDSSIARYKEDAARLGEVYQSLSDATTWETVPTDLAAVLAEVEEVADIAGSSIYVVTYDVQEQAVSLSRSAEVEDVAELPVKAKAAGSCLVQLDLDTQDVAGTVNSIQSMSLPVARYSVDYHNAELSIYFWSLGGGFGE